jgi:hypothetical protein
MPILSRRVFYPAGVVALIERLVLLASIASNFVNGHIFYVDGGVTAAL